MNWYPVSLKLWGYTNIDVIFKVTLSLGPPWFDTAISVFIPNLSAIYSRSEWIWAPSSNKAGYSSGHNISIILFWQDFLIQRTLYEPAMKKMQVKAKPRRRAFPPRHRQMLLFIKSCSTMGQKILMLSSIESKSWCSQILRVHFAVIIFNPFTSFLGVHIFWNFQFSDKKKCVHFRLSLLCFSFSKWRWLGFRMYKCNLGCICTHNFT